MDHLPVEVLEDIFALACTDGGRTGCALSLTSKGVRAVSRAARFHSIALLAYPSRLASFIALYERESSAALGSHPKVTHLHLNIPATVRGLFLPDPPVAVDGSPGHPKRPRHARYTPAYAAALRTLMRLLSTDLETLVLQYGDGGIADKEAEKPRFLDEPFSRLRELTVLGLPDLREVLVHGATLEALRSVPVLFPALARLHLVRKGLLTWPYIDLNLLGTHAPRVTHLRCSHFRNLIGLLRAALSASARGSSSHSVIIASSLAASLWIPQGGDERSATPEREEFPAEESSEQRPYASLRHIVLQPGPQARAPERLHKLQEILRYFDDLCRVRGIAVTYAKPCDRPFEDWGSAIQREWLDRLNGGEGCWKGVGNANAEEGYSFYGLQP